MSCADDLIIARLCKNKAHLVLRLKSDCNIKAPSDHGEKEEVAGAERWLLVLVLVLGVG